MEPASPFISPQNLPLAENGHQSAEFRQCWTKGSSCLERRIPPNQLTCKQINNINHF